MPGRPPPAVFGRSERRGGGGGVAGQPTHPHWLEPSPALLHSSIHPGSNHWENSGEASCRVTDPQVHPAWESDGNSRGRVWVAMATSQNSIYQSRSPASGGWCHLLASVLYCIQVGRKRCGCGMKTLSSPCISPHGPAPRSHRATWVTAMVSSLCPIVAACRHSLL